MSGFSDILSALGGNNGIGDDIGNVVNSFTGNGVPQNVTNVLPPQRSSSPDMIWIMVGGALILVLVLVLKK